MVKPAVAIMSRVPSIEGKSRLGGILTAFQREALQWAFLEDALAKVRMLTEYKCYLAATPAAEIKKLASVIKRSDKVIPQPEGNLGQRMLGVASQLFAHGHSPVIFIGTDTPALTSSYLLNALYLLKQCDFVFGPALDGGYYLIGMRNLVGGVFNDIDWGTDTVLEKTLSYCNRNNLTYTLLSLLMDIDRPDDLLSLAEQLKFEQKELMPASVKTIQFLKSIGRMK